MWEIIVAYAIYYAFINIGVVIYSFADPYVYENFPEVGNRIFFRFVLLVLGAPIIIWCLCKVASE